MDEIYYQIVGMPADAMPLPVILSALAAPNFHQAITVAMDIVKALEYLGRRQVCHLSVCPSSVYRVGECFRLGELWILHLSNGNSFHAEGAHLVLEFMRTDERLMAAPEFWGDRKHVGLGSDVYSLAYLILNLFSGKRPDRKLLQSSDTRAQVISEFCPMFIPEFATCLASALEPDSLQRTHIIHLREEIAFQAKAMSVPIRDDYFQKSIPSAWDRV
jgi:hypothetical protein